MIGLSVAFTMPRVVPDRLKWAATVCCQTSGLLL